MQITWEKLKLYYYRESDFYCSKCGGKLTYCHLGNKVYCIRCEDCDYYLLKKDKDDLTAVSKVGDMREKDRKIRKL